MKKGDTAGFVTCAASMVMFARGAGGCGPTTHVEAAPAAAASITSPEGGSYTQGVVCDPVNVRYLPPQGPALFDARLKAVLPGGAGERGVWKLHDASPGIGDSTKPADPDVALKMARNMVG
jgi:hypothetical protein